MTVDVPCRIGDEVYVIRHYRGEIKHIQKGVVNEMFFTHNMELCICVKHIARGKWGEAVFATHREALMYLERNKIWTS